MCGRYYLIHAETDLRAQFDLDAFGFEYQPRYNIAPQQPVPIIIEHRGRREIGLVRWGLVPAWAGDDRADMRTINARAETIATKPAYRDAFRLRRCIVPASGFYEWRKEAAGGRTPHVVRPPGAEALAFAGLWEKWRGPDGRVVTTCTIVTTEAAAEIRGVHERMPVILDRVGQRLWLDPETDLESLQALLIAPPKPGLQAYVVSRLVNNTAHDSPECLLPAERPDPELF